MGMQISDEGTLLQRKRLVTDTVIQKIFKQSSVVKIVNLNYLLV